MTIEQLKRLDLTTQQAKLYLAALELSPASAAELADRANIERTASYSHLKELVKFGLLTVSFKKQRTVFIAESPERIGKILEEKKQIFNNILPELFSMFNVNGLRPKVRYYEGQEGMRKILLNSINSKCKEKLHINPFNNAVQVLGKEFSRRYIETRVKNKIHVRTLRVQEKIGGPWEFQTTDENIMRDIRYLPKNFNLKDLIIIYNNTVAIVSSVAENYGLEVESKEFADTMRSVFEVLWAVSKSKIK